MSFLLPYQNVFITYDDCITPFNCRSKKKEALKGYLYEPTSYLGPPMTAYAFPIQGVVSFHVFS